jgi:hypothetical protein
MTSEISNLRAIWIKSIPRGFWKRDQAQLPALWLQDEPRRKSWRASATDYYTEEQNPTPVAISTGRYNLTLVKPQSDLGVVDHGGGSFTIARDRPSQFDRVHRHLTYLPGTVANLWQAVKRWCKSKRPAGEVQS